VFSDWLSYARKTRVGSDPCGTTLMTAVGLSRTRLHDKVKRGYAYPDVMGSAASGRGWGKEKIGEEGKGGEGMEWH